MTVLILILVEVALGVMATYKTLSQESVTCLNPYFSGSCSWRWVGGRNPFCNDRVLILILVEVALGEENVFNLYLEVSYKVLILILVEVALGVRTKERECNSRICES